MIIFGTRKSGPLRAYAADAHPYDSGPRRRRPRGVRLGRERRGGTRPTGRTYRIARAVGTRYAPCETRCVRTTETSAATRNPPRRWYNNINNMSTPRRRCRHVTLNNRTSRHLPRDGSGRPPTAAAEATTTAASPAHRDVVNVVYLKARVYTYPPDAHARTLARALPRDRNDTSHAYTYAVSRDDQSLRPAPRFSKQIPSNNVALEMWPMSGGKISRPCVRFEKRLKTYKAFFTCRYSF